ncbi:copper chaperone CopZ [Kribbella sp. VKM Ac-2527]|uniref:Copper chaperone CopZ n=1 Tax=Kribbella caucasensis TaxID=2512215 RepID=A0A4R6JHU0_9ACTN|nr:cation transporter [Kribbella sp. VKM Ac-2527]TDO35157.1 copper chaperone CopZ [Kribbella sp. VKM Ac-2527]
MSQTTYIVTGMTCGHCVDAVSGSLRALAGVRQVDVDLATGRVTVTSDDALPTDEVRAAVTEAGYELATDNGGRS